MADTVIAKIYKNNDNGQTAKTGDNRNITLWLILMILSSGSSIAAILVSKKEKYNK